MATTLPSHEKVSRNTDSTFANTGTRTGRIPEEPEKAGSPPTNAEMLLKALRNVIISLIRPADGEKLDANSNALGPNGEEFVTALKQFMSSFLHQRNPVGGVEVELKEKGADISDAESQATSDDDVSAEDIVDMAQDTDSSSDIYAPEENTSQEDLELLEVDSEDESMVSLTSSMSSLDTELFDQRKSRFIEKALDALRKHVFNTMPIRLLYFKPHASKLQITLIERSEILAHIASSLKAHINFADIFEGVTNRTRNSMLHEQTIEQHVLEDLIRKYSRYAILSHTWLRGASGEVTYGDWIRGGFDAELPGCQKLVNFCKTAWEDHGVAFGWMDTICINKESSAELDESIRSMYKWYSHAHVCITYLAETVTLSDMPNDAWFTRGWTLQELLSPPHIKFYNIHWNMLVESLETDKKNTTIQEQIEQATTITADELEGYPVLVSISRKMQLAAERQVTREEDSAYCLMGIFGVSISIAYGEGAEYAFSRLLQEILTIPELEVIDMFNWAGSCGSRISRLLPLGPRGYMFRSSHPRLNLSQKPIEPLLLTHVGLRITTILMPAISVQTPISQYDSIGDYHALADISFPADWLQWYREDLVGEGYSVLDARISHETRWETQTLHQFVLAILNVSKGIEDLEITVPKECLAVALGHDTKGEAYKMRTEAPIIFTLNTTHDSQDNFYSIKQSKLAGHGMKLTTLYL